MLSQTLNAEFASKGIHLVHIAAQTCASVPCDFFFTDPGIICPNFVIASKLSCQFVLTFVPEAKGLRLGSITIFDDALGAPHQVQLRGMGR